MSSAWGKHCKLSIFGESHGPAIGVVLDGLPAGIPIDLEAIAAFMRRRAPGRDKASTPRREADAVEIQSGLYDGCTTGTPLCGRIVNGDQHSRDYAELACTARPGHADYTGFLRYGGHGDVRGGGHFSGRLTAPLCFAGAVAIQLLAHRGIAVGAHACRIAGIDDLRYDPVALDRETLSLAGLRDFPVLDAQAGDRMRAQIEQARLDRDSVGGVVECGVLGLPAGIGSPMFDGLENLIASLVFGIPAVKGLEFGAGFAACELRGSQQNDPFAIEEGVVRTTQNNAGGILGGISSGMPLLFRVGFKPTPSISQEQQTVDFVAHAPKTLTVHGRHDPCVVQRAVPVVEAAAALAVLEGLLEARGYEGLAVAQV